MNHNLLLLFITALCCMFLAQQASATSTHNYKPGEYLTVIGGSSPDGRYAVAGHGIGEFDDFHLYLMDARTGKKIGRLKAIKEVLDTSPDAYYAKWSPDSHEVSVIYRQDRHLPVEVRFRVRAGHAFCISGPSEIDGRIYQRLVQKYPDRRSEGYKEHYKSPETAHPQ